MSYKGKDSDGAVVYFAASGAGTSGDPYVMTPGLPSTAATSAKQDTGNTSLASVDTKLTALGEVQAAPTANTILDRLKALLTGIVLAAGSARIGKVTVRNSADGADIDPLAEGTFTGRIGEVQASPTAFTVLDRLKALLTGIVLATGSAIIGKVGIDQTTPGTTNRVDVGVITAGETHIGEVGSPATVITDTTAVSTSPAYSINDCVGTKRTLTGVARVSGGKVILESLTIVDTSNQKAALTLLFFNADLAGSTTTDNAAFAMSGTPLTDSTKIVGKVNVVAGDYETIASTGVAVACKTGLALEMQANGSSNLYYVIITTGTPTYARTDAVTVQVALIQG